MKRGGVVLLVSVALLGGCATKQSDAPSPTTGLVSSINAAAIYREAYVLLPRSEAERDVLEDTEAPLDAKVTAVMRSCEAALGKAREARRTEACDWETVGLGVGTSPRNKLDFTNTRYLARAMTLQARRLLAERREQEALESLTDAFVLARRAQQAPSVMWRYNGMGMEDNALRVAARLVVLAKPQTSKELRRRFQSLPPALPMAQVLRADTAAAAFQLSSDWSAAHGGQALAEGDEPLWMRNRIDELNRYTDRVIAIQAVPWPQYHAAIMEIDKDLYRGGLFGADKLSKIVIPSQWMVRGADERMALTRAQFLAGATLVLEGQQAFERVHDTLSDQPFLLERKGKSFTLTPSQHLEQRMDDSFNFPDRP